jgi:hypothetical protein
MIKDSYPLPRIDEMMDWICRLELFTKFDLKSGYNQIASDLEMNGKPCS